jgi:hypothetical protein
MPTIEQIKVRVSAIGGTSFTLTPIVGIGSSGALVDGGVPVGGPGISSGITTIVVNSTGAPDTTFARHVNQIGMISLEMEN